jgi:CO dehydrogenase/acetyl-CoA synthase beta subunit
MFLSIPTALQLQCCTLPMVSTWLKEEEEEKEEEEKEDACCTLPMVSTWLARS